MFRILSHFVHCIGTVLLIVGIACQVCSVTSTEWIVHKLTSDNGLSYFEGLWHRCTIQKQSPVVQWACWNWQGLSTSDSTSILSTPIRLYSSESSSSNPLSLPFRSVNMSDLPPDISLVINSAQFKIIPSRPAVYSVFGARILLIAGCVLSSIGGIQVWFACKCSILVDENAKPCILLSTGAMACLSGIMSGVGVTWRAIQVLQESGIVASFQPIKAASLDQTFSNSKEKVNVTFGRGIWFGWSSMLILIIAGIILALASRLSQPRKSYPINLPSPHPNSRYTEYL